MSDTESSAEKIRELAGSGMTQVDIASSLGVSRQYVNKILKQDRSKARAARETSFEAPQTETLGSDMAALRDIIRESSTTQKADAIIRTFSNTMPNDFKTLAKLLHRARVPQSDAAFIIENWGLHCGDELEPQSIADFIHKGKKIAVDSTKVQEKKSSTGTIDDIHAFQLDTLDKQLMLMQKKQMLDMMMKDSSSGGQTPMTYKKVKKEYQFDEAGNIMMDGAGQPIMQEIEEEVPAHMMGSNSSGDSNMLMMMMNQMNQQNQQQQQMFMTMMKTMMDQKPEGDSKSSELMLKLMDTQKEGELQKLQQMHDTQMGELKNMMREKEIAEQFGGHIGELQEQLKDMKGSQMSDERFRLQQQVQLTGRLLDEVSEAKSSAGGALGSLAKEFAEDRRHLRHLERMKAAQDLGLNPSDVAQSWQDTRAPMVDDDELEALIRGG